MAEQQEIFSAKLTVLINDPKVKKLPPPTALVPQWTSQIILKLNDTCGQTYGTVAFRRKIKKNFSLAAIRYFFDYVVVEQVAWPTTMVYKSKTTWGEPMTMADNVRIDLFVNGQISMSEDPHCHTIESLVTNRNASLRLSIPLHCCSTQHKCVPPIFKSKHDGFFYIDIDLKLMYNDQDIVEQIAEADLPPTNNDPPVDNAVKYASKTSRITNIPIYISGNAVKPGVELRSKYFDHSILIPAGPAENPLVIIRGSGNDLLAVIAFHRKLTEFDQSIQSIREQFDYIKFGFSMWDGNVEPETKEWYEALRQDDGVQLELTYELNPPEKILFVSDHTQGDIPKLRISYATDILQLPSKFYKFSTVIDINLSALFSH